MSQRGLKYLTILFFGSDLSRLITTKLENVTNNKNIKGLNQAL